MKVLLDENIDARLDEFLTVTPHRVRVRKLSWLLGSHCLIAERL
jgi:hypothetical protein